MGHEEEKERKKYLLNISVTRSISCSAAAIFSADEGCGRPRPNIDMIMVLLFVCFGGFGGLFVGGWSLVMISSSEFGARGWTLVRSLPKKSRLVKARRPFSYSLCASRSWSCRLIEQ